MTRSRYTVFDTTFPHFFTCTTVKWIPLFNDRNLIEILYDSFRFMQQQNRLTIYAYVIMENHIHFVAAAEDLLKEVANFKSFTAHKIIDALHKKNNTELLELLERSKARHKKDRLYQVWQEGSHPQAIFDKAMMEQKINYIHHNPVKRGLVEQAEAYPFSSATNYAGLTGLLEVEQNW